MRNAKYANAGSVVVCTEAHGSAVNGLQRGAQYVVERNEYPGLLFVRMGEEVKGFAPYRFALVEE